MRKTTITKITVATRRIVVVRETGDQSAPETPEQPVHPARPVVACWKMRPVKRRIKPNEQE
jgi:hypothetical protein